jgi:hypothetical protein
MTGGSAVGSSDVAIPRLMGWVVILLAGDSVPLALRRSLWYRRRLSCVLIAASHVSGSALVAASDRHEASISSFFDGVVYGACRRRTPSWSHNCRDDG